MAKKTKAEFKEEESYNNRLVFCDNWVRAWIENRMEFDRQILFLSTFAIGLLVGVMNESKTVTEFSMWFGAGFSFLICIVFVLITFNQNADYLKILLAEHQAEDEEKDSISKEEHRKTQLLGTLNKVLIFTFAVGIVLTISLAMLKSGFVIMKGEL